MSVILIFRSDGYKIRLQNGAARMSSLMDQVGFRRVYSNDQDGWKPETPVGSDD